MCIVSNYNMGENSYALALIKPGKYRVIFQRKKGAFIITNKSAYVLFVICVLKWDIVEDPVRKGRKGRMGKGETEKGKRWKRKWEKGKGKKEKGKKEKRWKGKKVKRERDKGKKEKGKRGGEKGKGEMGRNSIFGSWNIRNHLIDHFHKTESELFVVTLTYLSISLISIHSSYSTLSSVDFTKR